MRKIKLKQIMAVILAGGILWGSLTACSKPSDSTVQQTVGAAESETQTLSGKLDNNTPPSQTDSGNVPATDGEYVYDYQVSMDPIPKEIADLGGPCQGTIHAFPSKIEMGLTQKMMEEDPELKAEVEKRIPEVEQALKEEFGGEFRVDGVDTFSDEISWDFFCTEIATGYQFSMMYENYEYYSKNGIKLFSDNKLHMEDYRDQIETEQVDQSLKNIVGNHFDECVSRVWVQSGVNTINLYIIQFTDDEVDKVDEQIKLLELWEELQDFDNEIWYTIDMQYFSTAYREVIEQKCTQGNFDDMVFLEPEAMLQNGELRAELYYVDWGDAEDKEGLDFMLSSYKSGKYHKKVIWKHWISD